MRPPARAIVGQLVFSADAGVWAVWRVESLPLAHASTRARPAAHGALRSALLALPEEALLLSVCERVDPAEVVGAMIDGVDLDAAGGGSGAWRAAAAATLDDLEGHELHRRSHFLAALLPEESRRGLRATLATAAAALAPSFGLPPAPVPRAEVEARTRQAAALEARLASLTLRRARAGELRWLYARALRRGLDEPTYDDTWEPAERTLGDGPAAPVAGPVLAPLTDAVVVEGGSVEDEERPRHRRYVRVETQAGVAYQAQLVVADMPHEWLFPGGGGEWLAQVEAVAFPVDWAVRLRLVANAEASGKARHQHRQLVAQLDEYDGEVTGAPASLAEALGAVDDERAALAANPAERECQATMVLSVAAADLPTLEERAGALQSLYAPADYGLARPTGGQAALLRAMLPGTAAPPVCRDYTQFLLARDLAAGAPFCSTEVGDPTGLLIGASLDAGVTTPVLMDPAYGPKVDRSASVGMVGALGAGKSYLCKLLAWATVARGGQVVVLDRTVAGEYVALAASAPGRSQVVRLGADAPVCLDPLRVFTGEDRRRVTLGFCTLLTGAQAQSLEGAVLAEAVDAVAARSDGHLDLVVEELRRLGDQPGRPDPEARAVARKLALAARLGPARLAFGRGEPLRLDADYIVFSAPGLSLPDRDTLRNEVLARQLLPEQVVGQALLYLVAAVCRSAIFADPARFAAALFDEAWALTATPQGQALLLEGVRDGRKHNAAVWLASQSPRDLGEAELVDLLGNRFVFRQARGATGAAARFLGLDDAAATSELLERGLGTGQCLWRDVRDRTGLVAVLEAPLPELRDAFDTNPSRTASDATAASSADVRRQVAGAPDGNGPRRTRRRSAQAGHHP